MSEANGNGLAFPTLELGGRTYIVKFSRGGLLYRLNKNGAELDLAGPKSIAATIDLLYAALWKQFEGSPEDLADLVFGEEKMTLVGEVLGEALKKSFPADNTSGAAGGSNRRAASPVIDSDEGWLRSWAFATSPHGLGLSNETHLLLTPREYDALEKVHEAMITRWAIQQAMFANVNFLERDSSGRAIGEPFTADDFMGRGNREVRTMEKKLGAVQAQLVNAQLAQMKPGDEDGIPDWAKGEYRNA